MKIWARIRRELTFLSRLNRLLRRIKPVDPNSPNLVCDDFERAVDLRPNNVALVFEDRQLTYRELDALANRYAHWIKGRGVRRGDTVALFMPNRLEYVAIWLGFTKVGVATALINYNLTGAALAHCLETVGSAHILADVTTWETLEEVRPGLSRSTTAWVLGLRSEDETSERRGLDAPIKGASAVRPDRSAREGLLARDTALYIFTSGTTGMPKAARITHARAQLYMFAMAGATGATAADRIYCALPLYHSTGGLCAVGAALMTGGALIIKSRFSAHAFWEDAARHGATLFVYIGEVCRYLVNQPESEGDRKHAIRMGFGNGLRPEVWTAFMKRFGIAEILEFYGSTEGNVSLFNFDGKPGAIGRIPAYLRSRFNVRLVRFDLDKGEPLRGADGLCQEARVGEAGEAVGLIRDDARHAYTGYADKASSEKKVLRDVFQRGDAWFQTGDLMRQDGDGYFYFVDRIGDTYRWKGENVSTTEVAERLAAVPGVQEVTVYGVPVGELEGKAGMAALVVDKEFDIARFTECVDSELPPYARPVFVRVLDDLSTTGTFKYRKVDLEKEGFDPRGARSPVWYRDPEKGYVRVTARNIAKLQAGAVRL